MNKRGMDFWILTLIIFATFVFVIVLLTTVGKTQSISGNIKDMVDKASIYKTGMNLFTISASTTNQQINLKWTITKSIKEAKKFRIYITPENPEDATKYFDNPQCTQQEAPRACTFTTNRYYVGGNLVQLNNGRYNVLVKSYTDTDRFLGDSKTVVIFHSG